MPKSYKICPVRKFETKAFSERSTCLDQQLPLNDDKHAAVTKIRASAALPGFEDFRDYVIEHDRVVKMPGRYGEMYFPEFTYTGVISAYFGEKRSVLLLNGKKADVLSFCATTTKVAEVQIDTLEIDMNALQESLPSVNLVWFKFAKGMIRASALMGANVEKTDAFAQSKSEGEISTLSFYFEDLSGKPHPVMIVEDGTVVLQSQYPDVAEEISLVTSIHDKLIAPVATHVSPRDSGKKFSVSLTPP